MSIDIPAQLIVEIQKGRCSLFLGAGASREAGFPSTYELADYLANNAGEPLSSKLSGQPLSSVAEYFYQEDGFGKQWVRQRIIEYFDKPLSQKKEFSEKARMLSRYFSSTERLNVFKKGFSDLMAILFSD